MSETDSSDRPQVPAQLPTPGGRGRGVPLLRAAEATE
jgi:hypothetical protein